MTVTTSQERDGAGNDGGPPVCLEGGTIGVSDRLDVGHMEGQGRSSPAQLKGGAM